MERTRNQKCELAEAKVTADLISRGYQVAFPFGTSRYDLIVDRKNELERVQVKYVASDGNVVKVKCRSITHSRSENKIFKYLPTEIEWIATYDETTDKVYYVSSDLLGEEGRSEVTLRLVPTKDNQSKKINWAHEYTEI